MEKAIFPSLDMLFSNGEPPKDLILQLPTGAGKTHLARLDSQHTARQGFKIVYLCPLKTMAQEIHDTWAESLKVGLYTADTEFTDQPPLEQDVLIFTYEKFEFITRFWREHWDWIPQVNLLVVDEFHMLADPHRGPTLESALTRFRRLNPFVRTLALSATLGNLAELGEWLQAETHHSTHRPVPLNWRVVPFTGSSKKDLLQAELSTPKSTLVFVGSRSRAEHLAEKFGAAAHHAGLSPQARQHTEAQFRAGKILTLFCTPTLEMGLNLPAQRVILYDMERYHQGEYVPISVNSAWQRAGRAGRPGLHLEGEAVVFIYRYPSHAQPYLQGQFEPIRSGLKRGHLTSWIVAEIAARTSRNLEELQCAYQHTLRSRQHPEDLGRPMNSLIFTGALKEEAGSLKVTRTGWIAARYMLQVETVLQLSCQFSADLTFFDLLVLATSTPDVQALLPSRESLRDLLYRVGREPRTMLTGTPSRDLTTLSITHAELLGAYHTSCLLRSHTRQEEPTVPSSDLRQAAEQVCRVLQAFAELLPVQENPALLEVQRKTRVLALMVRHGLTDEHATLTLIPGIGGVHARTLLERGITDIESLALSDPARWAGEGIRLERAERWVELAAGLKYV
ncbi:DEAD/DEAH box helicase [Deinococcus cellulosilyticus]|uniref:DEAD/DEAH box helicase n=2 Tax=Deinococcus cellulosilyticus TaxID=401558 RepID=UPI003612904A